MYVNNDGDGDDDGDDDDGDGDDGDDDGGGITRSRQPDETMKAMLRWE